MQKISKVLVTTFFPDQKTAWTKARADVAKILKEDGYSSLYLPELKSPARVFSFLLNLKKQMPDDGHILIEYPFDQRKRIYILSLFRMFTKTKVYALIHDLDALRNKSQPGRELRILNSFDGLISHNPSMTRWLRENGFTKPLIDLNIFDYCSESTATYQEDKIFSPLKLLFAGNLSYDKAKYIYDEKFNSLKNVSVSAYGAFFESQRLKSSIITYKGVFDPSTPVLEGKYHFGLVWDGTSMETCDGEYGAYMRYNNPHKVSLYIALGLPIIVWKEAAIAEFILDREIGVAIDCLADLENLAEAVDAEHYRRMVVNVGRLTACVKNGDFLNSAVSKLIAQPVA